MSLTADGTSSIARHIYSGCGCRSVQAPVQRISAILEQGKTPLLRVKTTGTDKLDLGATSYEAGKIYVVVLPSTPELVASPVSNTIATCQLTRIADRLGKLLVEEVRSKLYFWLGPLCTPIKWREAESSPAASVHNPELCNNAYAILAMDDQFLKMNEQARPGEIKSVLQSSDWTKKFSRVNVDISCARILLMASTGFVDLRDALDTDVMRSIFRGDEAAETPSPDP